MKRVLYIIMSLILFVNCIGNFEVNAFTKPKYMTKVSDKSIWVKCSAVESDNPYVRWYFNNNDQKYYLFLPNTADLSSLVLYHNFNGDITVDGKVIKDGDTVNFLSNNTEYEVIANNNTYTLCVMQGSEIPSLFITTESGNMDYVNQNKENKESGTILLLTSDGSVNYEGNLTHIKGRGNTTWNRDKKPYNIKLETAVDLMGMGVSKNWCLLANAQDATMLRNKAMYDLASYIGLEYSPSSCFVDLYANGEYLGVYQLCQKVELGKNNLVRNIYNLESETEKLNNQALETYPKYNSSNKKAYKIENNPTDITGGYLLEYVPKIESESGFNTSRNQSVDIKSPEYASVEQLNYISSYIQSMEDAIYSSDGYNSEGKHYSEYIDVESFAKMYLLEEFSKNVDSGITSCYFYKDTETSGGKIKAGPAWDFDVALGNLYSKWVDNKEYTLYNAEGWWASVAGNDTANSGVKTIFAQLCQHEDFNEAVAKLWEENFKSGVNVLMGTESNNSNTSLKSIKEYDNEISASAEMNYKRWSIVTLVNSGGTYNENIKYLSDFITNRYSFFNISFMTLEEGIDVAVNEVEEFYNSLLNQEISDIDAVNSIKDTAIQSIKNASSTESVIEIKNNALKDMRQYVTVTAYFDNNETKWNEVYIYYWNENTSTEYNWPGIKMESCGNEIYKYTIQGDNHLIFNNGNNGIQTVDIDCVPQSGMIYIIDLNSQSDGGDKIYYKGEWQSYNESETPNLNINNTQNNTSNQNSNINIDMNIVYCLIMVAILSVFIVVLYKKCK